jgi:ubiquinone/menaquinone biosynthesis C-methylase UbiE
MENQKERMWDELAAHWEFFEFKNFTPNVLENYADRVRDPILLIGAGQGLVTQPLRQKGLKVVGVDWSWKMVERGMVRRGEPNFVADALSLPFKPRSFRTVIFASGTLDFMFGRERQSTALREAKRVLEGDRGIIINFTRPIEKELLVGAKVIGLIEGDVIHAERAFELWKVGEDPAAWAKLIKAWRSLDDDSAHEIVHVGLAALRYLFQSLEKANRPIIEHLNKEGKDPMKILEASLSPLPLWTEERISDLLHKVGLKDFEIQVVPELYVALA